MQRLIQLYTVLLMMMFTVIMGCSGRENDDGAQQLAPDESLAAVSGSQASPFGSYQPLPGWSTWCGGAADPKTCQTQLYNSVEHNDRKAVRRHAWHLWASIWAPLNTVTSNKEGAINNAVTMQTNFAGTEGCWEPGGDTCSGWYPLWMSWPNTGSPIASTGSPTVSSGFTGSFEEKTSREPTLLHISRRFGQNTASSESDPNPRLVQTVNTPAPNYTMPPLVLVKGCGLEPLKAESLVTALYGDKSTKEQRQAASQKIEQACNKTPNFFCANRKFPGKGAICDGLTFVNQGDIMIATESLSEEGFNSIRDNKLYRSESLNKLYSEKDSKVIPTALTPKYVSTKHMFWPVKGCKPGSDASQAQCKVRYGALPVWIPARYKDKNYATNASYVGYEEWSTPVDKHTALVAIDTKCRGSAEKCKLKNADASLQLYNVTWKDPDEKPIPADPIVSIKAPVFSVTDFAHVQISGEVLKNNLTAADRGLLDAAMIWAYGPESNGFEAGDFLVTVAMHINTKEVDSWTFQSVWWSPKDDNGHDCPLTAYANCFGQSDYYSAESEYSGLTAADRKAIDERIGTAWAHYLMTDSYGIASEIDGKKVKTSEYFPGSPPEWAETDRLPVSMNPYIEPVIHPLGTNCQNCHRRAGYPGGRCDAQDYPKGCGLASYQAAQCPDLLGNIDINEKCLTDPWIGRDSEGGNHCKDTQESGGVKCESPTKAYPLLLTDLVWIIADGHFNTK